MSEHGITLDTTVNEVVLRLPGALPVLGACGIDTCCGGALALGEAARRHGLDPDDLLDRLLREPARAAGHGYGTDLPTEPTARRRS